MMAVYPTILGFFLITSLHIVLAQQTAIIAETIKPLTLYDSVHCYIAEFNRTWLPSCQDHPGTVILMQNLYVGSKLNETGCPPINDGLPFDRDECCNPNLVDDCIFPYSYQHCCSNQTYHLLCSSLSECSKPLLAARDDTSCRDDQIYMTETFYMFMDYACVDEARIFPINWTDPIQGMNEPVYFQTLGYPSNVTRDKHFVVRCRAMASSNDISVYNIDVRLSERHNRCEERLSFSNGTEGFERSCNETIDDAFRVTKTDFEGSVEMVFESNATGNMGYVWVGFYGDDLTINCTYERPEKHKPTPPNTTQGHRGGPSSTEDSGMSAGAIAGIVVALGLLLLLVLLICLCCFYKKKKEEKEVVNPKVAGTELEGGKISGRASMKSDFVTSVRAFKNSFVNTFIKSRSGKYTFAAEPKNTTFRHGMTIKRGNTGDGMSSMIGNSSLTSRYKSPTSSLGRPLPVMSTPEDHEEDDEKQGSTVDMSNYKLPCMASLYLGQPMPKSGDTKQGSNEPNVDVQEGPSYLDYRPSGPAPGRLPSLGALLPPIGLGMQSSDPAEGQAEASGEVKERRKRKRKKRRRREVGNAEKTPDDNAVDNPTYMGIHENRDY